MPAFGRAYSEADLRDVATYIVDVLGEDRLRDGLTMRLRVRPGMVAGAGKTTQLTS